MSPPLRNSQDRVQCLLGPGGLLFAEVILDGWKIVRLLVSPGSTWTALTGEVLTDLGVDLAQAVERRPALVPYRSALVQAAAYRIGSLQVGRWRRAGPLVNRIDLPAEARFDGVLGADILSAFHLCLNPAAAVITLRARR